MLLPFPTHAGDWHVIWQKTKTLTIATAKGDLVCTPIYEININSLDDQGCVESVKMHIGGGHLIVAFSRAFKNLNDEVVYTIVGRNSTQGRWYVPERILKALREGKEYEQ